MGQKTFVISSIVDLTERRKIERKSQERSDEISEFSYRTSHDLKSPLLTVGGLIDYVIEDIKEGNVEEALQSVEKIKRVTQKLSHLVDDILALTKTDINVEELSFFDFPGYVEDANEKYSHMKKENSVNICGSFVHKKQLSVQNTRLTQVLDNMISNGIKYSDHKKSDRHVTINTFNDANRFYIRVEDNGIGIPEAQHNEVFGMFKRFHPDHADGSGLGLYMIKRHIEKLNAQIKFESGPDGTTFYLEFPLVPMQDSRVGSQSAE